MSDAKVVFDYDAEADDELTLKEGDLIRNIEKKEDGWWEGELNGRRGMFPENFVQEIKKAMPDPREEKAVEKPIHAPKEVNTVSVAKVTFDYTAENEDELSLKEGEIVKVLNQEEEGWWKGEVNGKIGVFPANFVELVKGPIPAAESQPVAEPLFKEPAEKVETPEKKAKMMGGMGFGGILTKDALSGIKLRKSNGAANISPNNKTEKPSESSELSKKLSMKRKAPAKPTSKPKERALVEFEYDGEQNDELTLHKGDIVTILEKDVNEGWCKGELNGKVGLFPDNFVKLLPPEEPKKPETDTSKDNMASSKKGPIFEDIPDAKPSRPEFPHPKKKPPTERPPPPHPELPVSLKPVPKPVEEITKKTEPPPLESKPEEKAPKLQEKPPKKSPPSLPKKPDKPKPLLDGLQSTKDQPPSPPTSRKPAVVLRHTDHLLDKDPSKRKSDIPVMSQEVFNDAKMKRNSQGSDVTLNLNDIRSTNVLQPLTTDRPKNPAKNPPTRYGKPHSPKKIITPEERNGETDWLKETKELKEAKEVIKPVEKVKELKEAKEVIKPVEKPKKPALPESSKPKITEPTMDSKEVKKLQDEINALKDCFASITKELKEHVQKSEKRFQKMEKKLLDEIEDVTKELDDEKKARSAVDVEVNRLRKLIKNQLSS